MIQRVIENLRPQVPHRFVFLVLNDHLHRHGLVDKLIAWLVRKRKS